MVDISADVAHPVAIDDCPAVQVEAVVVALLRVLLRHAATELCLTDHLPQVLQDELTCVQKNTVISRKPKQTNTSNYTIHMKSFSLSDKIFL